MTTKPDCDCGHAYLIHDPKIGCSRCSCLEYEHEGGSDKDRVGSLGLGVTAQEATEGVVRASRLLKEELETVTIEETRLPDFSFALEEGTCHTPEMVEHPAHYGGDSVYEVIKVLKAWGLESDALLWNVVKYVARSYLKDNLLEDLKKARFYLDRRIAQLESDDL